MQKSSDFVKTKKYGELYLIRIPLLTNKSFYLVVTITEIDS